MPIASPLAPVVPRAVPEGGGQFVRAASESLPCLDKKADCLERRAPAARKRAR